MASYTGAVSIVSINGKNFYEFSGNGTITFLSSTTTPVIIVAGGGGGGAGQVNYEGAGGGGGGGIGYGTLSFISGQQYTITVGSGGSGAVYESSDAVSQSSGTSGSNSSIVGGSINAVANGGGRGGSTKNGSSTAQGGGSSGGSAGWGRAVIANTTGSGGGLTYIGNGGGTGAASGGGGGGGGASSTGEWGVSGGNGGSGGNGYTWSYTNQIYGGGGGGGFVGSYFSSTASSTGGTGGTGGGGTGGGRTNAAIAGTSKTGGGGGGACSQSGFGNGANGGSGVVYILIQVLPTIPAPWGAYIAGNNTSTTLFDTTGNGRHATISGSGYSTGNASGNGATVQIPYISGTTSTTITWPSGSIPSTFTICSITRATATGQGRVFDSSTFNFLHGHWQGKSGVAFYNQWMTQSSANGSGVSNYTDWLVMCGTNGQNSTSSNILANGSANGSANGGTGGGQLTINAGLYPSEISSFSFQQVIIWDVALTNDQLSTMSSLLTNYLTTGIMNYPKIITNYSYASNDIGNSFVSSYQISNGLNIYYNKSVNNLTLYSLGTRSGSLGFNINQLDIGWYFQRDLVSQSYDLGNYTINPWETQGSVFQYARWIWNNPNAANTTAGNVYLWFYYTFFYSGATNTGTVYAMCDNVGEFWFNGVDIGAIGGGWGAGSTGNSYSISIKNGLNYIRVAAYNTDVGAAGLLVALYSSTSTHIVSSSSNWVFTTSPSYNTGASVYNDSPPTNINVSNLTYNTGGTDQFPKINSYNVLYITSGTGTVTISPGVTIRNIFAVGGGAGGNNGSIRSAVGGGKVSNNNVNISGSYVFSISIGSGGTSGTSGSNTTVNCSALSIAYTANGGTSSSVIAATQYSYNSLYYGGAGGNGFDSGSSGSNNAPLGGGGGGGGNGGSMGTASNGGKGGGISASLTGGNGGTPNGGAGVNSPYGGGGGAGGTTGSGTRGGNGGSGLGFGTAYDYDRVLASTNNSIKSAPGGSGGVNTGGGGGSGAGAEPLALGGKGGSGIVVIVYT